MRIKETKIYKFEELSSEAKEKAREWWRRCENEDSSFQEDVFEDAATIAELFGLGIRQTRKERVDGSHRYAPTIYYSGFSSQGDGACFEGSYSYKKGALKAVKEYAPQDKELHRIVTELQSLQKDNFYRVVCTMKHSGRYYHSGCMAVKCENSKDSYWEVKGEDDFWQCMRDFADWIYKCLEENYDWVMSDEQVDESIIINEYEFTEEGEII